MNAISKQYIERGKAPEVKISRIEAGHDLEAYYRNVDEVLDDLEAGRIPAVRTPWAFFRSVPENFVYNVSTLRWETGTGKPPEPETLDGLDEPVEE